MSYIPLVSIIIPTFNRAHIISETLDSVLAQTYSNWECIVVDDGSKDNTEVLMKDYLVKDSRFQYHHRPKERLPGGNEARNYGFEVSRGDYINWLDSDDLFSNKKLESQIKEILKDDADVAVCKWGYFKDKNKDDFTLNNKLSKYDIRNGLSIFDYYGIEHAFLPNHNFLIKRSTVIQSGLWNINLTVNQDGEFFARVLVNAQKVTYADAQECFVLYRKISGQKSRISTEKKAAELFFSWKLIETQLLLANVPSSHPFLIYYKNAIVKKAFKFKQVLPRDIIYYKFLLKNYIKIFKKRYS